jgi:hypothetical protein
MVDCKRLKNNSDITVILLLCRLTVVVINDIRSNFAFEAFASAVHLSVLVAQNCLPWRSHDVCL